MIEKQLKVGGYKTVPLIVPEPYEIAIERQTTKEIYRIYPEIYLKKNKVFAYNKNMLIAGRH